MDIMISFKNFEKNFKSNVYKCILFEIYIFAIIVVEIERKE